MSSKHTEASSLREEVGRLKSLCATQEECLGECMKHLKVNQKECERLKSISKKHSDCFSTVPSESPGLDDKDPKDSSVVIKECIRADLWNQKLEKKISLMEELELLSEVLPSERQMNIQYLDHLENIEKQLLRLRTKLAVRPVFKKPDKKNVLTSYKDHIKRVIDYSFTRYK